MGMPYNLRPKKWGAILFWDAIIYLKINSENKKNGWFIYWVCNKNAQRVHAWDIVVLIIGALVNGPIHPKKKVVSI